MWESLTAVTLLLAGANVVILRHPESATLINKAVASLKGE
jgi:CO dehydrogenase/acetyl-CoA synthase delta subunit